MGNLGVGVVILVSARNIFGYAGVILVNIIWAGGYPATAIALHQVSPGMLTLIRLGTGALVLLPFLRLPRGAHWTTRSILLSALLGIVGFAVPIYLSTIGLKMSNSAMASIAIALEPLFTVVIGSIALRERLSGRQWIAFALALVGAWTVAGCPRPGVAGYVVGDALLLVSVVCYAVYNVFVTRLTKRTSSAAATSATLLAGFLATLPVVLTTGTGLLSFHLRASTWIAIAYMALAATAVAYFLWISVLQHVQISSAALSLYLQPVVGVALSVWLVHSQTSILFYVGSLLILGAIALGTRRTTRK